MIKIRPGPDLSELLDKFAARGGEIEFEFYDAGVASPDFALHREAVKLFLDMVGTHYSEFASADEHDPLRRNGPRYSWDDSQLTGKPISFAEFWGSELPSSGVGIPDGFKTAFFLTPYGLSGGIALNQPLFEDIIRLLFPFHLRSELTIYAWNTECSSYFNAGREWWGTFFWTLNRPAESTVCVITASTTD